MLRTPLLGTLLLAAAVAHGGCERRKGPGAGMKAAESWSEEAAPGVPPADDPHAGLDMGGAGVVDPHAGLDMGGGGGAVDPHAGLDMGGGGNPGGLPAPDPDRPIDPSKFLRGTIQLGAATRDRLPGAGVVFLAVRPADAAGNPAGAPIAVDIIENASFPSRFELTEAQAMIGGTAFAGAVVVTARFDQDHDVDTKQPGDMTGRITATIPATDLVLELDTVLP